MSRATTLVKVFRWSTRALLKTAHLKAPQVQQVAEARKKMQFISPAEDNKFVISPGETKQNCLSTNSLHHLPFQICKKWAQCKKLILLKAQSHESELCGFSGATHMHATCDIFLALFHPRFAALLSQNHPSLKSRCVKGFQSEVRVQICHFNCGSCKCIIKSEATEA